MPFPAALPAGTEAGSVSHQLRLTENFNFY
jgi:hypothetical protein